jgi:hypothetical protein
MTIIRVLSDSRGVPCLAIFPPGQATSFAN